MNETQARSNIYALLSRVLLQESTTELLEQIQSDANMLELFPTFATWDETKRLSSSVLVAEHLNPDFSDISLLHLIPYETFYTRDDQMIETGGANPVTDIYSAYDFIVDYEAARVVSSDHIGVELEFMHHLCEAQRKAEAQSDLSAVEELKRVEKEFLNKHLLQWAPLYLINLKYEARTPYYYDIAQTALEFLLSDNEYLTQGTPFQ